MSQLTAMNTEEVIAEHVNTTSLTVNDTTVNGIETSNVSGKTDKLITRSVLNDALADINRALNAVDPEGDLFQDLAVISMSLVDNYFSRDTDWVLNNWVLQDNCAYCYGGQANNALTINRDNFSTNGVYYAMIDVALIPSGHLEVRINDTWLASLTEAKEYIVEIPVSDITTDKVSVVAVDVSAGESAIINFFGFYYLTPRFYKYFTETIIKKFNVNPDNYVTVEAYRHAQEVFLAQFQAQTSRYLMRLDAHENASNPHNITPGLIGAAEADHTHANYLTTQQCAAEVEKTMTNYAKLDHTHANYISKTDAVSYINGAITTRMQDVMVVDPLIISAAPSGILPSRWMQTDITPPLTVLIPNTLSHWADGTYDYTYGITTTNVESLKDESPKVFSPDMSNPAVIDAKLISDTVNFRIRFHSYRVIKGYRIHCIGSNKLTDWKVISGNTTFIHRVTDPTNYTTSINDNICEMYFSAPQEVESLAFIFGKYTGPDETIKLKIELLIDDLDTGSIGITKEGFTLSIPDSGANYIVSYKPTAGITKITMPYTVDGLPMFVFASPAVNGSETTLNFSVSPYPPEIGNIRKGLDVFADKFKSIAQSQDSSIESYVHPAFGKLTLESGYSHNDHKLKEIYDTSYTSWRAETGTKQVIISQTFDDDNVVLVSYLLNWRKTDLSYVPESWTLTVEGYSQEGTSVTAVFDSVEKYYPFYSVDDDDIVYHAKFENLIRVKKVTLTMNTTKENSSIALNRLCLYTSRYYYAVPSNTVYVGSDKVKQICIGYATHDSIKGWVTTNLCLGRSVVIPVNNLNKTTSYETYEIPNPFFTTDVTVGISNYVIQNEDTKNSPDAYISEITPAKISVVSNVSYRHAVSISRTW